MLKPQKRKHKKQSLPGMHEDLSKWFCLGLTFAGLDSLNPHVISVPVANASAIFIPSTARGAATDSAGFLERAALCAHRIISSGDR